MNRLGYVITRRPFEPDDSICVFDPEDLEDLEERIASEGVKDEEEERGRLASPPPP